MNLVSWFASPSDLPGESRVMASKEQGKKRTAATQIFDCDPVDIAPGTKSRARLPRGLESDTLPRPAWWLFGGAVLAAFLAGAIIGRFVLS